jgi:hypothetical protein
MRQQKGLTGPQANTSYCSSVALSFSKPLHCLNKQHSLRFGAKVKWLTTMRNEMLESWPASARPHLYAINHERTREIVKHAHKKSLLLLQKAKDNGKEIVVANATD